MPKAGSRLDANELRLRWSSIFCTCAEHNASGQCTGCSVMRTVLHDWGILGLRHMLRQINALEDRHAARERDLRERITTLETQLELMRPRGFLED